MSTKTGGGKKPQEYDPSTGRYGVGSSGFSKSYTESNSRFENFSKIPESKKFSRIMPNYRKAITSDEKFLNYSLDENSMTGRHKALVYKSALGFCKENYLILKEQIHNAITSGTAKIVSISKNQHGIKYAYDIPVKGVNGRTVAVRAVYMIGTKEGKPRLITNYVVGGKDEK